MERLTQEEMTELLVILKANAQEFGEAGDRTSALGMDKLSAFWRGKEELVTRIYAKLSDWPGEPEVDEPEADEPDIPDVGPHIGATIREWID